MSIDYLQELGWSKAKLARKLGINADTVSRWGTKPPRYAVAYMELALEIKKLAEKVEWRT